MLIMGLDTTADITPVKTKRQAPENKSHIAAINAHSAFKEIKTANSFGRIDRIDIYAMLPSF
jgi:hypothetical protein